MTAGKTASSLRSGRGYGVAALQRARRRVLPKTGRAATLPRRSIQPCNPLPEQRVPADVPVDGNYIDDSR